MLANYMLVYVYLQGRYESFTIKDFKNVVFPTTIY